MVLADRLSIIVIAYSGELSYGRCGRKSAHQNDTYYFDVYDHYKNRSVYKEYRCRTCGSKLWKNLKNIVKFGEIC